MKIFLSITLISALMLCWNSLNPTEASPSEQKMSPLGMKLKSEFCETFQKAENANVLWGLMTGDKWGINPRTQKDFRALELGFLFSPSGLHLSSLLVLLFFLIKIFLPKKAFLVRTVLLCCCFFLPYLAIKRIVIFQLLNRLKVKLKWSLSSIVLFFITFLISFLLGHFKLSPMGFILSFLFMGTFLALGDHSRFVIILGLFSSHLLVCLFTEKLISPLALILNLPLLGYFSLLIPAGFFYLISFKWIALNWVEPLVRFFIQGIHFTSKISQVGLINASLPLILALWVILMKKDKRYLALLLLLHASLSQAPALFRT